MATAMPGRHSGGQVHKVKKTAAPLFSWVYVQRALIHRWRRDRYTDDCHIMPYNMHMVSCDYPVPFSKGHTKLEKLLKVRFNICPLLGNAVKSRLCCATRHYAGTA